MKMMHKKSYSLIDPNSGWILLSKNSMEELINEARSYGIEIDEKKCYSNINPRE